MTFADFRRKVGYIPGVLKENGVFLRVLTIRLLLLPFTRKQNNYWMILERGKDAQDNAWHLFKYMVKNHPDFKVKYAIDKQSIDYRTNLKGYEQYVVQYDSITYYYHLFSSNWVVSTHLFTITPSLYVTQRLSHTLLKYRGKVAFLQHGIIHNDHQAFHYPILKIDLFITGAKTEFELATKLFNQPDGVLQCTGLARFDNLDLERKCKKQILIMPTWRASYVNLSDNDFMQTDFFQEYEKILTSRELKDTLIEKDYKLVFYNHFEFQKFNHLFESLCNGCVKLGVFGEKRVQELLNESALLVTDYSSVYYDFIYMQKPVVFFKFNKEQFQGQQYGDDYDNAENFGDVSTTSDGIVNILIRNIENDCNMPQKYVDNMNMVFNSRDHRNCERIFHAINQLD